MLLCQREEAPVNLDQQLTCRDIDNGTGNGEGVARLTSTATALHAWPAPVSFCAVPAPERL